MPMLTLFQTIILLFLSILALSLISTIPYLMVGDTEDFATHEAIFISEIIIDDFLGIILPCIILIKRKDTRSHILSEIKSIFNNQI